MSTRLTLRGLCKRYHAHGPDAVASLDLEAAAGELVALLGPSGCGKTTILKMIAGLLAPTAGEIAFNGERVNEAPAEQRGAVMVFQNHLLFPHMTVHGNIAFGLKMRGVAQAEIDERVARMIALVRLEHLESRRPSEISGGQRQRVALARALIVEPRLLLLDEPLSNLDAHLRDEMRNLILSIHHQLGLTTIVVTHDQQEAVVLADRIALIFDGRLQQDAPPRAFYEQPISPRVAAFFGNRNLFTGTVRDSAVHTAFGPLQIETDLPDSGDIKLTIQPEAIQLVKGDLSTPNGVNAVIKERLYVGTHWRYRVELAGGVTLDATASPDTDLPVEGSQVSVDLPPGRVWAFPEG